MKVGELFVELGVVADSKTLKEFAQHIGNLPLDVATGIAALAGLEFELTKLAAEAMNTAVGFQMFSSETGLSWKELQKWQLVAEQANVSAESVATSVTALERNLAEIRLGRGNIAPFQLLGISPNQNAFGILQQLRERIKGLDRPTAVNLISQMGLSPDMIHILEMSNVEFEKLSKNVHGLTEGQVHDFLEAKQALVQWAQIFKYTMFDIISHFTSAIEKSLQFKKVLIGVGVALAALAVYFFPVTAAMVGLILVLDDLAVYFTGGKSIFGDAIDGLKRLGKELANSPLVTISKAFQALNPAAFGLGAIPLQAAGAVAGNKTVQNIFNVSVTGSGPAGAIAQEVTRQIAKHMGRADQQINNQGH